MNENKGDSKERDIQLVNQNYENNNNSCHHTVFSKPKITKLTNKKV